MEREIIIGGIIILFEIFFRVIISTTILYVLSMNNLLGSIFIRSLISIASIVFIISPLIYNLKGGNKNGNN